MCLQLDIKSRDKETTLCNMSCTKKTHLATAVHCQRQAAPTQTRSHHTEQTRPGCHAWQRSPWCHASSRAPRRACTAASGPAWRQVALHDTGTGRSGKAKCMAQSAQLLHCRPGVWGFDSRRVIVAAADAFVEGLGVLACHSRVTCAPHAGLTPLYQTHLCRSGEAELTTLVLLVCLQGRLAEERCGATCAELSQRGDLHERSKSCKRDSSAAAHLRGQQRPGARRLRLRSCWRHACWVCPSGTA